MKSDWENRAKFWEDIRQVSNEWDYVIDFSCLKARHMWTIIDAGFIIGTYIYVSTDSVYEVTEANYTKESLDKIESDEDYVIEDEMSSSSSDDEETKEHRLNDVLV